MERNVIPRGHASQFCYLGNEDNEDKSLFLSFAKFLLNGRQTTERDFVNATR
jgi:hypothetical protein